MNAEKAAALREKLAAVIADDETFHWFAVHYMDALDRDRGLEDIVEELDEITAGAS